MTFDERNKLTKLFNKFAGREIPVVERTRKIGNGVKGVYLEVSPVDPHHPTLEEMTKLAKANGLTLRLWYPGMMGTMDFNDTRINAYVKKEADGKYRVGNNFKIG